MKFIFGSTKEQVIGNLHGDKLSSSKYLEIDKYLSKLDLQSFFKLSDKKYAQYLEYKNEEWSKAITCYHGITYRQLQLDLYSVEDMKFLQENVIIISARYGPIHPNDLIQRYRLDFTKNIGINLAQYWKNDVAEIIKGHECLSLASNEFTSLCDNVYYLEFLYLDNGVYKAHSVESKKMRGLFLNMIILDKVKTIDEILLFEIADYKYSHIENKKIIFKKEN